MLGVPVSIIFGNTETCGICTHSVRSKKPILMGYIAKPFICNSLRRSDTNTLLISGSNIAESSRSTVDEQGSSKWFDSGISILIMKNYFVVHKMPRTYDSNMPV